MKKFLFFGLLALIMVAVTSSCTNGLSRQGSAYMEKLVDQKIDEYMQQHVENPTFETIADVTAFQLRQKEDKAIDSVFYSLSISKLVNVSSVLLNKNGVTNKEAIVAEYLENIDIYNNLVTDYPYQHLDVTSDNNTKADNPTPVATVTQTENVTETENTNNAN